MLNEETMASVVDRSIEIYRALGSAEAIMVPAVITAAEVVDRETGLSFAIQQIGWTLEAIGGPNLVAEVIYQVEDRLDDVNAAVFLNRRWDGYPRP